jgi:hypothetical protein
MHRRPQVFGTIVAMAAGLTLIGAPAAQAAPPANDNIANAIVIPGGSALPFFTSTFDVSQAGFETSDPIPNCISSLDDNSIWFKYTPIQSGTYTIWNAAQATATTVDDTVLAVYTTPTPGSNYTEIACDDDSATNEAFQSILTTNLTAGVEYYLYASALSTPSAPNNLVQLKIDRTADPVPPANDNPAGAELLSSATFPVLSATYDIKDATSDNDPPLPSCRHVGSSPSRSTWYKITPDQNAAYRIWAAASGPTATTVTDTIMAVYTSPGGAAGPFTEIPTDAPTGSDGCSDDDSALQSLITTRLNSGTEYWIVVWKFSSTAPAAGQSSVQVKVDRLPGTTDTDLDGVLDGNDNCPADANADQTNTDGDDEGDACDADDDGDAVLDADDECDLISGATTSGCPPATGALTLTYKKSAKKFSGELSSDEPLCLGDREVVVFKKVKGPDKQRGEATTDPVGAFTLDKRASDGKYYVTGATHVVPDAAECADAKSPVLKVH